MPERTPIIPHAGHGYKDAVCIDANKIFDSCADKDCLEDLDVYFTEGAQMLIDNAISVKCKSAEVIDVLTDIEPVAFNRGFFTVDTTFFFLVKFEVFTSPLSAPISVIGLSVFTKKCILYGSEGNVKVFGSDLLSNGDDEQLIPSTNMPRVAVQVVDPVVLSSRLIEKKPHHIHPCCIIPHKIKVYFEGEFEVERCNKRVVVTLGLFTIMQLSRNVQLLIPVYDYCIPQKECDYSSESPCELFKKIKFPKDEFFPVSEKFHSECGCDG